jgi:hypothetical protein
VGAIGCVLPCLALNGLVIRGLWLSGHMPGIGDPRAWLLRTLVCAELGHKDITLAEVVVLC